MANFENMTLSYTQIASIPFKVRKSASGSLLDALSRDLTPGQRVALFPSYVNQLYASAKYEAPKEGETTPLSGGGETVLVPPTVEKYTPAKKAAPRRKQERIIPAGLIPGPDGKPMRVPDAVAGSKVKSILNVISKAEGTPSYDTQFGYQNISREKSGGKPITQMTINEVRELMRNTPKNKRAMGRYQFVPGTFDDVVKEMGLSGDELFSPDVQDKMIIHRLTTTRNMDKWLNGQVSDDEFMHNLAQEFASLPSPFNDGKSLYGGVGYNSNKPTISLDELRNDLTEIKTMENEQASTVFSDEQTAEPVKTFSSVPYDDLRSEYPDIIDEDSTFWDKIDPSLKAMKDEIVDKNGRKVGRETLIAADAAAKVLRQKGFTPRVVSGGDEHSKNHGEGTSVNRSIDIQAYDADGNKVHLGHIDPQVRKDMLTASQLSVKGENFRIGVPTDASDTGMHIQSDPDFNPAIWGYSAGEPYSRETLKNNNPEYIKLWEENQKLNEDEKQKTLEALIGPFEGMPTEEIKTAEVAAPAPTSVPVKEPPASSPNTVSTSQGLAPKPTKNTLREMMGGYNAAAGGAEITEPSMIISEDGKKVTRVAETGPEKISVMPRHKSSDVYQEDRTFTQEMQREVAQENLSKRDIAEQKSNPMPSNFGQQRNYGGQTTFINTDMPKVPPSANKAFADAKLVSRFNKADIDGDMGIVYVDRGYA